MAPIAGRPFLEHLLRFLRRGGMRRVVLCAGYGAEAIRAHFGQGREMDLEIVYSIETELQGTGGAIRLGAAALPAERFIVLNGDSFVEIDIPGMLDFHQSHGSNLTVALARVPDTGRFGAVDLEPGTARLRGFGEKQRGGAGLINAGVYLVDRAVTDAIPQGVVSFERDVLPRQLERGGYGFVTEGLFIDIGIPADYERLAAEPASFLSAVA